MSRSRRPIPKHCRHKASNRGVVRLSGRDHYTGPWGSPEAQAAYERLIAEWLANGRTIPSETVAGPASTEPAARHDGPTVAVYNRSGSVEGEAELTVTVNIEYDESNPEMATIRDVKFDRDAVEVSIEDAGLSRDDDDFEAMYGEVPGTE